MVFTANNGSVKVEAARAREVSYLGLTIGDFSLASYNESEYIAGFTSPVYDDTRLNIQYYSDCSGRRELIRETRTRVRDDRDLGYYFRNRLPSNTRYDCNLGIDLYSQSQTDRRSWNYLGTNTISPASVYDPFSVSGSIDRVYYDGKDVVIEGYAVNNLDYDDRVKVEFYNNQNLRQNRRRLGSDRTDRDTYRFSEKIRLSRLDSDLIYVYAKVDGLYQELAGSPVRVDLNYVDPSDQVRNRRTTRSRNHSSDNSSTRSRSHNRSNSNQSQLQRQIQTLENRYGPDALAPYTDANNNYISLSYDSTLASLLQDHARKYNTQFGSKEHMDKLRSQRILKEKSDNWYIDLSRLESRLD
jgi:hypothetical protein